jgi:hypothetical protein
MSKHVTFMGVHTKFCLETLKRPFVRHRCRWEDNIIMDFEEGGGEYGLDTSGPG